MVVILIIKKESQNYSQVLYMSIVKGLPKSYNCHKFKHSVGMLNMAHPFTLKNPFFQDTGINKYK